MADLDVHPRVGQVPSDDDLYWPAAMRQVQVDIMSAAHKAAHGVLALDVIGWLLVSLALFFGISGRGTGVLAVAVWLLPLVFWSLSALWALRVFTVRRYRYFANSPDSTREAVMRIARKKTQHLYWSIGLWAVGVASFIVAVVLANV